MAEYVNKTIADLFQQEPFRWGLRGDPGLWQAMKEHFEGAALPQTAPELQELIAGAFFALTGKPLTTEKDFYLEKYDQVGMSAGMISMDFWKEDALPLLMNTFKMVMDHTIISVNRLTKKIKDLVARAAGSRAALDLPA